jgi:hypothetical protein
VKQQGTSINKERNAVVKVWTLFFWSMPLSSRINLAILFIVPHGHIAV